MGYSTGAQVLKNFKENEKGNVSLITAIGIVPILLAVAAGIETTNLVNKKSKLQDAVDSAVLAAIQEPNRKEALKVFKEHLGAQG